MFKLLLISSLSLAGFAWAQTKPDSTPWAVTKPAPAEAPATTGYQKAENGFFPKTASYNGKWTVNGFSIVDSQGNLAFTWKDTIHAIKRKYMSVSWAPDSQRVVLLDQFGRAQVFYAAELLGGIWREVPDKVNLNPVERRFYSEPKVSLVDHVNLGQWVSMTAIQIQDHFLVTDIPLAATHWEDATAILQFGNGALRVVN
jgi:hypothetical protein